MDKEQKVNYLRIALNIHGFNVNTRTCDLIATTYEAILEKEGDLNLKDVIEIEKENALRYTMTQKEVTTKPNEEE